MHLEEVERIETELFLQALFERYGYDFRHYTPTSIRRRMRRMQLKTGLERISQMIPLLLYDKEFAHSLISEFSITVTEMFRDPEFFRLLRQQVVPYLRTYPFIRAWNAGCATGEEAYALAILLQEEGLYEKSAIFATDFNELALSRAREGIYDLKLMRQYTANYQKAGGHCSFADYYHARYESAIMEPTLKTNVTFAHHNLVTDGVFSQVHLVLCRNVLIYFDRSLRNRVLQLITESLVYGGFLCLGTQETLRFSDVQESYRIVDATNRIYQKIVS